MAAQSSTRIQSIAVIGPRNNPLFVGNYSANQTPQADLKFQYIAHSALDVVEERVSMSNRQVEQYLGLLFTLEDLAVYGFQTSTQLKVIVAILLSDHVIKDIDMLAVFKAVHMSYLSYASNPFHDLSISSSGAFIASSESTQPPNSKPIKSHTFEEHMQRVAGFHPLRAPSDAAGVPPTAATVKA